MAIQSRIVNNSFTEIYVGGGNSITQSAPTNFHRFFSRKILTAGETAADFREVTAAERAQLEAKDKEWVEPSEELIMQAETIGAKWNKATGFFEFNTLIDLTAGDMRNIVLFGRASFSVNGECSDDDNTHSIRTNWTTYSAVAATGDMRFTFSYCSSLEIISFGAGGDSVELASADLYGFARYCTSLRRVIGTLNLRKITGSTTLELFAYCVKLRDVRLSNLKCNLSITSCQLLSMESIAYMVEHAGNTAPITITLHADAYARLTDELIAAAAAKNITFTSI